MTPQPDLKVIIIAGPNGAGKTTFAREFLPNEAACPVFVNADLIAAGLAPFAPETAALQAGRLMLLELERYPTQCSAGMSLPFDSNHRSPSKGDRPILFVSAASLGGAANASNASPAAQSPTAYTR